MESDKEVAEVCDLIQEAGYDHPFEGISPGYARKGLAAFLSYVKHAPNINPEEGKIILTLPISGDKTTAILCHLRMLISHC